LALSRLSDGTGEGEVGQRAPGNQLKFIHFRRAVVSTQDEFVGNASEVVITTTHCNARMRGQVIEGEGDNDDEIFKNTRIDLINIARPICVPFSKKQTRHRRN
jgi:hypothetical protein